VFLANVLYSQKHGGVLGLSMTLLLPTADAARVDVVDARETLAATCSRLNGTAGRRRGRHVHYRTDVMKRIVGCWRDARAPVVAFRRAEPESRALVALAGADHRTRRAHAVGHYPKRTATAMCSAALAYPSPRPARVSPFTALRRRTRGRSPLRARTSRPPPRRCAIRSPASRLCARLARSLSPPTRLRS